MYFYLLAFLIALTVTLLLTPVVRNFALKNKILDEPNNRKIHIQPVPRFGGLAIYFGFLFSVVFCVFVAKSFGIKINFLPIFYILTGGTLFLVLGIIDDIVGLKAFTKLVFQTLISILIIYYGVRIDYISNPFDNVFYLGIFSIPVTLLWLVGMTNAMNLIDGLDGLASGITTIASLALFIVALRLGNPSAALILIAISGATLGFLNYNFVPASIFLGDSGSMLLGFILASASIVGVLKSTLIVAFLIPVIVLGVPIYDTTSAVIRRIQAKKHIFEADNEHIHHNLLKAGLNQREAVMAIYLICIILSFGSLIIAFTNSIESLVVSGFIVAFSIFGIIRIKKNIEE